jgi:hypothetical protein
LPTSARALLADNAAYVQGLPTRWEPPRRLSPAERQTAIDAVATLQAMLRPSTRDELDRQIGRLYLLGANQPSGDARKMIFAEYRSFLAQVPPDILQAGTDRHIASCPFWPKVADLMALMQPDLDERRRMLARAERLAALGPQEQPERHVPTREERLSMADAARKAVERLRNMPGPETVGTSGG